MKLSIMYNPVLQIRDQVTCKYCKQTFHKTATKRQTEKANKQADTQANRLTEKSKHILTSIQMKRHTGLWSPNVRNSFLICKDDI